VNPGHSCYLRPHQQRPATVVKKNLKVCHLRIPLCYVAKFLSFCQLLLHHVRVQTRCNS
jgi:hypothetical protein